MGGDDMINKMESFASSDADDWTYGDLDSTTWFCACQITAFKGLFLKVAGGDQQTQVGQLQYVYLFI